MQDPLELALSRELRRGERLQWKGRQLARISYSAFAICVFAIPWTAFALFWTAMAAGGVSEFAGGEGAGLFAWAFPLFGVPFILVGLGMLSLPFLPLFVARRVLFAVTDQRVLRLQLGGTLNVKSVPIRRAGPIERRERRDGSGSLRIAVGVSTDSDGDRSTEHFELGEVRDVMTAHDRIAQMAARAMRDDQSLSFQPDLSTR